MLIGSGIDVVENRRIVRELARGEWRHTDGVFTPRELHYCNSVKQRPVRFAQCFAAKEAVCKALGRQPPDLSMFRDVEAVNDSGKWSLRLHGRLGAQATAAGVRRTHLAIASTQRYTVAFAMLES